MYRCISAYPFITVLSLLLPCIIILFLHLLSTNHKCTQPCYFPLLLKPTAQKERIPWNSSTRSSRICVALVVVPVVLWSLSLFRSAKSHHSHYLALSFYSYTCWVPTISVLNLAIFLLLLKPTAQKERMYRIFSMRSSRLHVAPVVIPVVLWSFPLFHSAESHHSL
jgi:hypothetical protein